MRFEGHEDVCRILNESKGDYRIMCVFMLMDDGMMAAGSLGEIGEICSSIL